MKSIVFNKTRRALVLVCLASMLAPTTSSIAQEKRIAANWLHRLRRCLGPEQTDLFRSACINAGISKADIDHAQQVTQSQLDQVSRFVRNEVPDITLRMFAVGK